MGLFDGIVSAGLGIVGDILGGESEQASAEELAQQQFEHQKELARIQNEYNVENYKQYSYGINPAPPEMPFLKISPTPIKIEFKP